MIRALIVLAVLAFAVFGGCFGPAEDEDGLEAALEKEGYDTQVVLLGGHTEVRRVTSSPYEADADADGLDDYQERLERSDPRRADTDGDGLLDGHDVAVPADSSLGRTWRDLGIRYVERPVATWVFFGERGSDTHANGANPLHQDTDGDGLMDGEEVGGFTLFIGGQERHVTTLAYVEDSDGDRVWDKRELDLGLDPSDSDTDDDTIIDGIDLDPRSDVRVRLSVDRLLLTGSPTGGNTVDLWFDLQLEGDDFGTPLTAVTVGEETDGGAFSSPSLNPSDAGGDVDAGAHNLTFALTALTFDGSGATRPVDLFSGQTGTGSLIGRLNVMTGEATIEPGLGSFPDGGLFQGEHGNVTLRMVRDAT